MLLQVPPRSEAITSVQRSRTTPGRLIAITAGLTALVLLTVAIGLTAARQRADRVDDVRTVSGPLSAQALDIYRSLSDADASAATAFLANGAEDPTLRKRYLDDIARAGSALASALRATSDENDPSSGSEAKLRSLAVQLPVYSGLIETARAYNREQLPLGAAYLREASGLMRGTLLPAAQGLFTTETGQLASAERGGADFPAALVVLCLALVAGLVAGQIYLTRHTNRLVNPGLAIATLATVVLLIWTAVAFASAASHLDAGRRTGSAQFTLLAEARVVALQARADESLTLVARGNGAANERHFNLMLAQLHGTEAKPGLLDDVRKQAAGSHDREAIDAAFSAVSQWRIAHRQLRELDGGGNYTSAVQFALSTGSGSPNSAFQKLDVALDKAIATTGERYDRQADEAASRLDGALLGTVLLGLVALLGVVLGVRNRIREYR